MHLSCPVGRAGRRNRAASDDQQGLHARKGLPMFATAPLARSFALAGALVVAGASPVLAADGIQRPLPKFDFALGHRSLGEGGPGSSAPYVPSVINVMPPALLTDALAEPSSTPIADAAQTRPVDLIAPRTGGGVATSLRRSMYVSFAALQIMDAVSTRKALSGGAREANPVMGGIARNGAALFAVKAGTAAATTWFAEKLAKNHPRRATILMAVLNTAYAAIVAHNYRVARR